MKRIVLLLLLASFLSQAYSQAYEGNIKYDKKNQRAVVIEYPYSAEAVENAFKEKMSSLGYKAKEEKGLFNSDKGFIVFSNAFITDISNKSMDYIIKAERKSRKESDQSYLYMIMNNNGTNALDEMDAMEVSNAKSFLNGLTPHIVAADLELQILAQQDLVEKAEKKLKDLKDEQESLEKKLDKNGKDQKDTEKEIENLKNVLEALKEKRTPKEADQ